MQTKPSLLLATACLVLAVLVAYLHVGGNAQKSIVVVQDLASATSLDPADAYDSVGLEIISNTYLQLTRQNKNQPDSVLPGIAQSWTIRADNKAIAFSLRPHLKFASGNPVGFEDVRFSIQRLLSLNKASAQVFTQLGWTADNLAEHITLLDDGRVQVSWSVDFGAGFVLNVFSFPQASIVDKKAALLHEQQGDWSNTWLKTHTAGNGSFGVIHFSPGASIVLESNPTALFIPKLRRIEIHHVADPAAQYERLVSGAADVARDLGTDQLEKLIARSTIKLQKYSTLGLHFLALNQSVARLKNPAVWKAMRYAIDYDGIAEKAFKGSLVIWQSFIPNGFMGALNKKPYRFDPELARSILADAGIAGVAMEVEYINTPKLRKLAAALKASMEQAGITLTPVERSPDAFLERYFARQHESVLATWYPDYNDPHSNAAAFASNDDNQHEGSFIGNAWANHWDIPVLSQHTLRAAIEQDPLQRAAMYRSLQAEVQSSSPFIVAFQSMETIAMASGIGGFEHIQLGHFLAYENLTK